MIHVLIVVSFLGGAVQGAVVSTQEYSSAERCEAARMALMEYAKAAALKRRFGLSAHKSKRRAQRAPRISA